jgi:hypothetical protein
MHNKCTEIQYRALTCFLLAFDGVRWCNARVWERITHLSQLRQDPSSPPNRHLPQPNTPHGQK